MHRIDGNGATADNKFTEGNPTTGTPATVVTSEWANAIQEEIIAVIAAAGIELNKSQNNQLVQAIQSLISGGGVAVNAAGVTIADAGDYFVGGEVESALQQLAQKVYTGTFNANQVRRQVVSLTGDENRVTSGHAENIVEIASPSSSNYTIPSDANLNLPIGTSVTVVQTGAGAVNFTLDAGVTLLKPPQFNYRILGQHATAVLYKVAANTWRLGGMLEAAA